MMKLLIVVTLGLIGLTRAETFRPRKTFTPRSKNVGVSALSVPRGGAGPLDPTTVAKTTTAVALANNALAWLGPSKFLELYGKEDPSSEALTCWQRANSIWVSGALTVYLILFHDASVHNAIAYGSFPVLADLLRSILNNDQQKTGLSNLGQALLVGSPFILTVYACLSNLDNADMLVQLCCAFHGARGLYYLLDPEGASKAWGVTGGGDELHLQLVKWVGEALIGYAVGGIFLARGQDVLKVTGYYWIPFTFYAIYTTFVAGENDDRKPLFSVWIALGLAVVGTLVF